MQLKSVVLPAPFGPISPAMRPGATSKDTPSSATMPPKRTDTSRTLSSGLAPLGSDAARTCACATIGRTPAPYVCCLQRVDRAVHVGLSDRPGEILERL